MTSPDPEEIGPEEPQRGELISVKDEEPRQVVTWREILSLIQPVLTEEEKSLSMWQKVVQENYKAQKYKLEKYFEQVFSAINCSQIDRWQTKTW